MRVSAWIGRSLTFVVGAVVVGVLVTGCASPSGRVPPPPPVLTLLDAEQQSWDVLPPGAPARLSVLAGSTRSLGGTGMYDVYVSRGVTAPYCVTVTNVYGEQVGHACGGGLFGGDIAGAGRFEFGEHHARGVPDARFSYGLGQHVTLGFAAAEPEGPLAIDEVFAREQRPTDIQFWADREDGPGDPDSYRLIAHDRNTEYFVSRGHAAQFLCVSTLTRRDDSTAWGGTMCGETDIVIRGFGEAHTSHFSAAGFEGETPSGWRQVSPFLRVKETSGAP